MDYANANAVTLWRGEIESSGAITLKRGSEEVGGSAACS